MLGNSPLLLRDLLKEVKREHKLSSEDIGEFVGMSSQSINGFLRGHTNSLKTENAEKVENFLKEMGYTRNGIIQTMQKKATKPKEREYKTNPDVMRIVELMKIEMNNAPSLSVLARRVGIPDSSIHHVPAIRGTKMTKNLEKMRRYLLKKGKWGGATEEFMPNADDTAIVKAMGFTNTAVSTNEETYTSKKVGQHYVCVFFDDKEALEVLSCILTNAAMTLERKQKLIGKIFAQEFPTLA